MGLLSYLQKVPWDLLVAIKLRVRKLKSVGWPEYPDHYKLDVTASELQEQLENTHWEPTTYALKYDGEILNYRRPAGTDDGQVREDHLRARQCDDGLEVIIHNEPCRFNEKSDHVSEDGLYWYSKEEIAELLE